MIELGPHKIIIYITPEILKILNIDSIVDLDERIQEIVDDYAFWEG